MFGWLHRKTPRISEYKSRVLEALADYPPYAPPIWDGAAELATANREYVAFFTENRPKRIEALRVFLAKFDVALGFDDIGIRAVSAWLPHYADLLVDGLQHQESEELWQAYHWFAASWAGPFLGLNPVFDLGVFMGECILRQNPRLKWLPHINPEPNKGASHHVYGRKAGYVFDPIDWTYTECKNIHSARMLKRLGSEASLHGTIRSWAIR
jgi:hypothetical protein